MRQFMTGRPRRGDDKAIRPALNRRSRSPGAALNQIAHYAVRMADAVIVCPAELANTINRFAAGLADDLAGSPFRAELWAAQWRVGQGDVGQSRSHEHARTCKACFIWRAAIASFNSNKRAKRCRATRVLAIEGPPPADQQGAKVVQIDYSGARTDP